MYLKKGAVALLLLAVTVTSGWLLQTKNEVAITPDEIGTPIVVEENLRAVSFCGTNYYAEPAFLFGIDMMARIAKITTEQSKTVVCENLPASTSDPSKPLETELRYLPSDPSGIFHYLRIEVFQFSFDPETKQIFLHDVFDGTPHLFGTFR